jgi:acetolactate synthase-1/2/3 large subunit
MVDVDEHEMSKFEGRGIDVRVRIKARLDEFLTALRPELETWRAPGWAAWKGSLTRWREAFPVDNSPKSNTVHSHIEAPDFVKALSSVLSDQALIYVDTGGNLTWTCNNLAPKSGQSVHSAWNNTPMGYALPASIGASLFNPLRETTCIIGDGGLMICLAELATVAKHRLPIKILLFNNHGHGIQKQTLETWLGGRLVCVDSASGLAFPTDFCRVAASLGLPVHDLDGTRPILDDLAAIYARPGPVFVNVEINPEQKLYPVLKFGAPLENQMPELGDKKIREEMLIPPFVDAGRVALVRQQSSQGW